MSTNNNFVHTDRCGVTVVGSATVKVAPDSASVVTAVSRWAMEPREAFATAREGAIAVQEFLKTLGIRTFASSRISLVQEFRPGQGEQRNPLMGYKARISFNIKLNDLDRMEELVSGVVTAGANELGAVTFQTSLLQEMRNDARRQAMTAAREKAELYCREAGVSVGKVLAIDEAATLAPAVKAPAPPLGAPLPDPTEISIAANVAVTFEIIRDGAD